MSTGSILFKLNNLMRFSRVWIIGFWLIAGCSSHNISNVVVSNNIQKNKIKNHILHIGFIFNKNIKKNNKSTENNSFTYNENYKDLKKDSYTEKKYTVKYGDTLFYIAWITNNDFCKLAQLNNIHYPYNLNVGQTLKIYDTHPINNDQKNLYIKDQLQEIKICSFENKSLKEGPNVSNSSNIKNNKLSTLKKKKDKTIHIVSSLLYDNSPKEITLVKNWYWPVNGKVINNFSPTDGGNKGIDISGYLGQPVVATTSGKVVYVGNVLRGYGNLIIIKHDDNYLSAYAHNDKLLVKKEQKVQAGQKIATVGKTGTSSVKLYFEIRHKGESVNPLLYLSQRSVGIF